MNIQTFLRMDISLFSVLVMAVLIIAVYLKETGITYSSRIFLLLCWSTVAILVLEMMRPVASEIQGQPGRVAAETVNFLFLLINPLPATIWLFYLDYLFYDSLERLRKRWFYLVPMAVCVVLMIISTGTGLIFSIDGNNQFVRGPAMLVLFGLNFLIVIQGLIITLRKSVGADGDVISVVVLFGFIPAIGAVVQMSFYGVSTIWPLTALAVLLTYIFIEIQKEIRDYLTGLLTRQQIDDWIRYRIKEFRKKGKFTLIIIDMDEFKAINDKYGHEAGDKALVLMAYSLMRTVKRTDKVGRFGGDEFIIVLETAEEDVISEILERLRERVEQENRIADYPYEISYSTGYAVFDPEEYEGFKDFFQAADKMMYESKAVKH